MSSSAEFLNPSEAARRLGVSAKALRLYEQRGLVKPLRTGAGWRIYGPAEMARAAEVVALRALGLSLAQAGRVLAGDPQDLEPALAAHQARLEGEGRRVNGLIEKVREIRAGLAQGRTPAPGDLAGLLARQPTIAFDLPWPWGGERFELRGAARITYIVGSLGSGKTRLAMRLAEAIPGARFLPMDRAALPSPAATLGIEAACAWLEEEGATRSPALTILLSAIEDEARGALVVDMVEDGLDEATQAALAAYLRNTASIERPLFLMTRSNAFLDLAAVGPDEALLLCPANHSPPMLVEARPGAPGYEALAMCLAPPQVRARTEGMIAWRPSLEFVTAEPPEPGHP